MTSAAVEKGTMGTQDSVPMYMNCARSPTTLEDGVTLTMSPRTSFAVAYAALILSHSLPNPLENAWN